jgi:hypothetical protein
MPRRIPLAVFLLAAFSLPSLSVKHKTLWIENLGAYEPLMRDAVASQGALLHLSESREDADLVLILDERGADYAQILLREKFGRRDAKSLVAKDSKTGKVLVRQNLRPATAPSVDAVNRFASQIISLP